MQSPVFAFDSAGGLRLLNAAARALLPSESSALDPIGRPASSLNLTALLETADQSLYPEASSAHLSRWSVRRATFRLQQALINLLRNAVDAALSNESAEPDRTPQVTITWQIRAADLVLIIEDNGPGITNPSNLFVPFYTTKAQGSGIGLVLAQQIASAHHGAVTLTTSAATGGCRSELILPLLQPPLALHDATTKTLQ